MELFRYAEDFLSIALCFYDFKFVLKFVFLAVGLSQYLLFQVAMAFCCIFLATSNNARY